MEKRGCFETIYTPRQTGTQSCNNSSNLNIYKLWFSVTLNIHFVQWGVVMDSWHCFVILSPLLQTNIVYFTPVTNEFVSLNQNEEFSISTCYISLSSAILTLATQLCLMAAAIYGASRHCCAPWAFWALVSSSAKPMGGAGWSLRSLPTLWCWSPFQSSSTGVGTLFIYFSTSMPLLFSSHYKHIAYRKHKSLPWHKFEHSLCSGPRDPISLLIFTISKFGYFAHEETLYYNIVALEAANLCTNPGFPMSYFRQII